MTTNQNLTMSSREMSELTNVRHDSVLRTIKSLIDNKVLLNTICGEYKDSTGRTLPCYNSDKRDSLVIVARLSPEFTARVIDRWQELESKTSLTVFGQDTSTHRGALLALVASIDKIEADKPKVAYFDNLVERNLLINIRDSAKEIHLKQNEFVKWLLDNKYVYRDIKEQLKPYSHYMPSLFELKEYINPHNGKTGNQLLTTPRGRETFNLLINGGK